MIARPQDSERWMTPPEVGRLLRVAPETVVGWIRSGELRGVNVGSGAKRPRFRVSAEALADFELRRTVRPPVKPVRRRKRLEHVKNYFPETPAEGQTR